MIKIALDLYMFWFIYSLLGWIVEVIYAVIRDIGYQTRNKTIGPINPGYGIAAIILLTVLNDFKDNPFIVFLVGAILASFLEYICHWFFERYADIRLWDYSHRKFNLNGRICLANSIGFGLLCVLMVNIVHPIIDQFVLALPINFKFIFTAISSILYAIEITIIVVAVYGLRKSLNEVAQLWDIIKSIDPYNFPNFKEFISDRYKEAFSWYEDKDKELSEDFREKYNFKLEEEGDLSDEQNILALRLSQIIEDKFTERNIYQKILYRVFPDLKSMDNHEIFEAIKDTYAE